MKVLRLIKLILRNFKGVRNFVFDVGGADARVYGDNSTGKTTLFDAFIYLLFDKDSQNKKDFDIKTLDEHNNVIHGLEHEVEGTFEIDGRRVTLRKVFTEKWQKKRGREQEFTGHTTDYFIDGVPVKKKEYTDFIASIVDEDVFKLLTSPAYFNEQLHWEKRRQTLLQVCGDVSDEDVIASSAALAKLPEILAGRSIENHRKVIAARRREINDELQKLPIRIDEVHRGIPDISGLDKAGLQKQIDDLKAEIEAKESEVRSIQSGGEVTAKQNRIREIEGELLRLKNELQGNSLEVVAAKRRGVASIKREIEDLRFEIESKQNRIKRNSDSIQRLEKERDELRERWTKRNADQFEAHGHDETCTACGQALPEERIAEAHRKAEEAFNRRKAQDLEEIRDRGKAAKDESERLQEENKLLESEIDQLFAKLDQDRKNLEASEQSLAESEASVTDVESHPDYIAKKQEIATVQQEMNSLRASTTEAIEKVREEIATLHFQVDLIEQDKAKFAQVKIAKQRIEQLSEQEKTLAQEYERLEQELYLTEEFIRQKVNLLEDKINSRFRYARFKLFRQQINGGLEECCETLYKGVPYSSGLNNAARINVGLDIINTLSEHYGLSAPIFVDNAEAVTQLIDSNSQVVSLVVSAADKQLRVEANTLEEVI